MNQETNTKRNSKNREGISVILALIVTSIVLVIGVTVSDIVLGELVLSRTTDHSLVSFYGANAGIERALYHCRKVLVAGTQTFNPNSDGLSWNTFSGDGNRLLISTPPTVAWRITGSCDTSSATIQSTGLYPCGPSGQLCELNQRDVSRRSLEATY